MKNLGHSVRVCLLLLAWSYASSSEARDCPSWLAAEAAEDSWAADDYRPIYSNQYVLALLSMMERSIRPGTPSAGITEIEPNASFGPYCILPAQDRGWLKATEHARLTSEGMAKVEQLLSRCGLRIWRRAKGQTLQYVTAVNAERAGHVRQRLNVSCGQGTLVLVSLSEEDFLSWTPEDATRVFEGTPP